MLFVVFSLWPVGGWGSQCHTKYSVSRRGRVWCIPSNEWKIFTKVHGNNLSDSVTKFLFIDVVVVVQHLRAPSQGEERDGIAEMEICPLLVLLEIVKTNKRLKAKDKLEFWADWEVEAPELNTQKKINNIQKKNSVHPPLVWRSSGLSDNEISCVWRCVDCTAVGHLDTLGHLLLLHSGLSGGHHGSREHTRPAAPVCQTRQTPEITRVNIQTTRQIINWYSNSMISAEG